MKRPFYFLLKIVFSLVFCLLWMTAYAKNPYPSAGKCSGLERVHLKVLEHTCIGVVASGLKTPRGILPLSDNDVWVTEMGSWEKNQGRLSRLIWTDGAYQRNTILDKLDRPHGIILGTDGWIYVAEAGQIIRLDPKSPVPAKTVQTVITGLPKTGHHPLKQIVFYGSELYISVGAESDHCESGDSALNDVRYPCAESTQILPTASIWRARIHEGKQIGAITIIARGLRNSMGLAFSKEGWLIQTENSRDNIARADKALNDEQLPHDEINVIKKDSDYGWPYCFDNNRLIPEYKKIKPQCHNRQPPHILLPAHSAPLGLTQYPSNGTITALRGKWLIALHGYRNTGHRIVGLNADSAGLPTGRLQDIVSDWRTTDKQPMGAPTEVKTSPTGQVYITDDRNDTILRLSNH